MATTSSSSSVVHIHNSRSAVNGKAGGVAVAGKNLLQTANIQTTANAGASHSLDQKLFPSIPIDEENKSLCVSSCPTKSSSLISPKTLYGMCTGTGIGGAHFTVLPESENDSIIRRKLIRHFRFKSIDSQSNGHTRRQSAGAIVHYNDAPISADEDEHHAEHTAGMMDETTARRRVLAETMRQNYESLLGGTHVEEIMLALSINGDDAEKAFNWINESSLE